MTLNRSQHLVHHASVSTVGRSNWLNSTVGLASIASEVIHHFRVQLFSSLLLGSSGATGLATTSGLRLCWRGSSGRAISLGTVGWLCLLLRCALWLPSLLVSHVFRTLQAR